MLLCKLSVWPSSTKVGHSSDFTSSRSIMLTLSNHRPKMFDAFVPLRSLVAMEYTFSKTAAEIKTGECKNFMGPVMSVARTCFCLHGSDVLSSGSQHFARSRDMLRKRRKAVVRFSLELVIFYPFATSIVARANNVHCRPEIGVFILVKHKRW